MLQYSFSQVLIKIKFTTIIIYSQKNIPFNQLNNNSKNLFYQYNNVETWREKSSKRKILWCKKARSIWDVNADNIAISKLFEIETNSKYLIGILIKL